MAKHARPEPRRGWFGRRRSREEQPVVDLRDELPESGLDLRDAVVLADDPESVLARMSRLRDAGLITTAELEAERRRILGTY